MSTIAIATIHFFSELLHREVPVSILLPAGEPKGVLYLLHGFSNGYDSALRYSLLERYCADIPLAVVMPDAQNSFYTDTVSGQPYWSHISREVPSVLKNWLKLDFPREKTFVGGFSMGGYGAAKLALSHPEEFSGVFLFSPVTDIAKTASNGFDCTHFPDAPDYGILNMQGIFGNRNPADTDADLYYLLERCCPVELPRFRIYTGTEDFLYQDILNFYETLRESRMDVTLETSAGQHLWVTWENFVQIMTADIAGLL